MKIALVHDWLNNLGGAERVLIELHKIFPEAPIYTIFYNKNFIREYLSGADIRPSFLQKFPLINKFYKNYGLFMPSAIESFDLSEFDIVISSSAFFSKGLVLRPKTKHFCYCYSPTRQLWDLNLTYDLQPTTYNWLTRITKHLLRIWDRQATNRVDQFVAISKTVQDRIKKYYQRDSIIIYPPLVSMNKIALDTNRQSLVADYYLIVSRLYKYKNIDMAIEAFNKLGYRLIIIGVGPEYKNLKSKILNLKSQDINLAGFVSDSELAYYYNNCKALIMPQEEDFGLTAIEAMKFGKPVLALKKGGALEIVAEGKNGEFFDDSISEALAEGVYRLNKNYDSYDKNFIINSVEKFSAEKFKNKILELIK